MKNYMKFQTGHNSAAVGAQLTWDRQWLAAISSGRKGKRSERCKGGRFVNLKWELKEQSCGLLCLCCGFWHQLAWAHVEDQDEQQSWLLRCMEMDSALLGFRGFTAPGSSGDKTGLGLKKLKRGARGSVAPSPQQLKVCKGLLVPVQLIN